MARREASLECCVLFLSTFSMGFYSMGSAESNCEQKDIVFPKTALKKKKDIFNEITSQSCV